MDKIKLKLSIEEARSLVDALYLNNIDGLNPPAAWLKLAKLIQNRLLRYEYAYGNGAERTRDDRSLGD